MNNIPNPATRTIDPGDLGLASRRPGAAAGPQTLFPGDRELIGKAKLRSRTALWGLVSPRLDKILTPDEKLLHVCEAVQKVSAFRAMSMGAMVYAYHQVFLVLTDRRLVEVLLDPRGKAPESRIRSVPWRAVSDARVKFGSLRLRTADGRKLMWSLRVRGDRKLISAMLPKMQQGSLIGGAASTEKLPAVHCPGCGETLRQEPERCQTCGTMLRSKRLARILSLAIPGGGLFYLGHPFLGTLDLLGEMMILFVTGITLAAASGSAAIASAAGLMGFLILLTKAESLHVGDVLSERLRPDTEARRGRWRTFSKAGAFASVLVLILIGAGSGTMAGKVDRDLDFAASGPDWSVTRDPAESALFPGDPALRSEWTHPGGWTVSVFAYPLGPMESFDEVRRTILAQQQVAPSAAFDEIGSLPPNLAGFSTLRIQDAGPASPPLAYLNYFVFDEEGKDLHQVLVVVPEEETEAADRALQDLLQHASWTAPPAP